MKRFNHSYDELAKVAKRYYGDANMCGVICLAATAKIAFGKAKSLLEKREFLDIDTLHEVAPHVWDNTVRGNPAIVWDCGSRWWTDKHYRNHRKGTPPTRLMALGKALGFTVERIPSTGRTLGKAMKALPKDGVYWVWTTRHITAVVDGEIMDWSDESRRHKVRAMFKITRHFEQPKQELDK